MTDVNGGKEWWQTLVILALAALSLVQVTRLLLRSRGRKDLDKVWEAIAAEERSTGRDRAED